MTMTFNYRVPPRSPLASEKVPAWAYEGSPYFHYTFGGIVQGAQETINLVDQIAGAKKYEQFDELLIHNDSAYFVYLVWNDTWQAGMREDVIILPPSTTLLIEKKGLRMLTAYNAAPTTGQDIAALDIRCSFRRKPWGINEIARRRFFER